MLKRLLGLSHLEIWEGRASVIKLLDVDMVVDRIAYLYANPAQDNLTKSIDEFPGFSSWSDFNLCLKRQEDKASKAYPFIRLPTIPKVKRRKLTPKEDLELVRTIREQNVGSHDLVREPNAWMSCFEVDDCAALNSRIIEAVRSNESKAVKDYRAKGKTPLGRRALCKVAIMKPHTPKKRDRKLFVLATVNKARIDFILTFKNFTAHCIECYQMWLGGDFTIIWPLGAFKPPMPPGHNLVPI